MTGDVDLTDVLSGRRRDEQPPDPSLPGPRPEPSERIDERVLTVWRISGALSSLIFWVPVLVFLGVSYGADFLWPWSLALLIVPIVVTILQVYVIPPIEWRRWRYEVTEREVDLRRGVFVVTRTLIPMSRVQHVDTQQGPLLRHYELSAVTIATASGVHEIPGLSAEVADDVRNRIAALAGVADDV